MGLALLLGLLIRLAAPGAEAPPVRADSLYMPAWSPDGKVLSFDARLDGKWAIFLLGTDGAGLRRLTPPGSTSHSTSWSPDGGRIAFLSERDGPRDVYTMRSDGTDVRRLTRDDAREFCPRWSPDGAWIAFLSPRGGAPQIWRVRPDGTGLSAVTAGPLDVDGRIAWSPDSARLAFFAVEPGRRVDEGTPARLYVIGRDGGAPRALTAEPAREFNPTWSRAGRIAFDAHENGQWESDDGLWEIWSRRDDGSDRRRLTRNRVNDWGPAYSPDGTRIAYCSGMNDRYEIWIMEADGARPRRLTRLVYEGPAPGEGNP